MFHRLSRRLFVDNGLSITDTDLNLRKMPPIHGFFAGVLHLIWVGATMKSFARRLAPALAIAAAPFLIALGSAQQVQDKPYVPPKPAEAMDLLEKLGNSIPVPSGQEFFKGAEFVGSKACEANCHRAEYREWKETWHAKILRDVKEKDIVLGNFKNKVITFKDQSFKATPPTDSVTGPNSANVRAQVVTKWDPAKKEYSFIIRSRPGKTAKDDPKYEVVLVVGGKWQQTYHVRHKDFGNDLFPAPIRWDVKQKAWEVVNFQPENWVACPTQAGQKTCRAPNGAELPYAVPRKPADMFKSAIVPPLRLTDAGCMGCHTTGSDFAPDANGHWRMQAGAEHGVGCERCHGPGSKHIEAAKAAKPGEKPGAIVRGLDDLTSLQQSQMCVRCHARLSNLNDPLGFPGKKKGAADDRGFLPGDTDLTDRVRFWSFSGAINANEKSYFFPNEWGKKSRVQWQDFSHDLHHAKAQTNPKANLSCLTCHAFHGKTYYSQLRMHRKDLCGSCHSATGSAKQPNVEMFKDTTHEKAGVTCVDCHMSARGQRLTATRGEDDKDRDPQHDVSFHVLSAAGPQLGDVKVRNGCQGCHTDKKVVCRNGNHPDEVPVCNEQDQANPGVRNLDKCIAQTEAEFALRIKGLKDRINAISNPPPDALGPLKDARDKLEFVDRDGSFGMHNKLVASRELTLASGIVNQICAKPGQTCPPMPDIPAGDPLACQ
jgi:predicted CXXCH cytochrome family protein